MSEWNILFQGLNQKIFCNKPTKKSPSRNWIKFPADPSCLHSNLEFVVWWGQEVRGSAGFQKVLNFSLFSGLSKGVYSGLYSKEQEQCLKIYFSLMTVGWSWLLIWLFLFVTCSLITCLRKTNQFGENADKNDRNFISYPSARLCLHASLQQVLHILEFWTVLFR